jgi:hypothetical protein
MLNIVIDHKLIENLVDDRNCYPKKLLCFLLEIVLKQMIEHSANKKHK